MERGGLGRDGWRGWQGSWRKVGDWDMCVAVGRMGEDKRDGVIGGKVLSPIGAHGPRKFVKYFFYALKLKTSQTRDFKAL